MRIERENGRFDKVNFSLCIYVVKKKVYESISKLLNNQTIHYEKSIIVNDHLTHQYYFDLDLEGDFDVRELLKRLRSEIAKDEKLKEPFKIYCNITSSYDQAGIHIPADFKIFYIQEQLKCALNINFIMI